MTKKIFLFTSAFLEGTALMALELISSRLLAVGFGSTLKVWAILLSLTLLGLALGYFLGGKYASKPESSRKVLLGLSLFLVAFFAVYPQIGNQIVLYTGQMGLFFGTFLASLMLVFVPLCAFGMYSPILIDLLNANETESSGKTAGLVYGISTLGGILATFLFGLFLIPEIGVRNCSYLLSVLFLTVFVLLFFSRRTT